jgi:hypothetical protein
MLAVHPLYSDGDPEDNTPEQMKTLQEKDWQENYIITIY